MKKIAKAALLGAMMISSVAPAMAATSPTDDTVFYSDLLNFLKANFAFQGAEYSAFKDSGLFDQAHLDALSSAYSELDAAQLTLVQYLQTKVTVS